MSVELSLIGKPSDDKLTTVQRLGSLLQASGYFSDIKDAAQAAVKVMAGDELGIAPVAAVMGIHIIKGKVSLSGNLIAAMIRRHGYNYRHTKFDNKGCTLEFIGKDGTTVLGESSFNEEDAKTAGVFSDMYRKFPRNMYFNRAISNGAKWFCPEATCGLPIYVPEEMGATVNEEGDYISSPAEQSKEAQQEVGVRRIEEERQRLDASRAAKTPEPEPELFTNREPPSDPLPPPSGPVGVSGGKKAPAKKNLIPVSQDMANAFKEIKKLLHEATGGHELYYSVLDRNKFKKSNEIRDEETGRFVYKQMAAGLNAYKAIAENRKELAELKAKMGDDDFWDFAGTLGVDTENYPEITGAPLAAFVMQVRDECKTRGLLLDA